MLSAIGTAEHLRPHGIEVAVDLPGVGKNLSAPP
jgi:choline dehydrogenase